LITFGLGFAFCTFSALVLWCPPPYFSLVHLSLSTTATAAATIASTTATTIVKKKVVPAFVLLFLFQFFFFLFHSPFLLSQIGWVLRSDLGIVAFSLCYLGCLYHYHAGSLGYWISESGCESGEVYGLYYSLLVGWFGKRCNIPVRVGERGA